MKKKIKLIIPILLLIIIITIIGIILNTKEEKSVYKPKVVKKEKLEEIININRLRQEYNNQDIVAYLEIPNVLGEPIVQTNDNDYYLHNDIYKNQNIIGANFLDYRNNLDTDKKLLIYSHSDPEGTLPFVKLANYNNQEFFDENKYIYLTDLNKKRKYEVFSSYIETRDFDYVNLKSFNGLTYEEHLNKLKNKSFVKSNIELDANTKVLILQTCSFNSDSKSTSKFQLVIAKEIDNK